MVDSSLLIMVSVLLIIATLYTKDLPETFNSVRGKELCDYIMITYGTKRGKILYSEDSSGGAYLLMGRNGRMARQ